MKLFGILAERSTPEPMYEGEGSITNILGWVTLCTALSMAWFMPLAGIDGGRGAATMYVACVIGGICGLCLAVRKGGLRAAWQSVRRDPWKWLLSALVVTSLTGMLLSLLGIILRPLL